MKKIIILTFLFLPFTGFAQEYANYSELIYATNIEVRPSVRKKILPYLNTDVTEKTVRSVSNFSPRQFLLGESMSLEDVVLFGNPKVFDPETFVAMMSSGHESGKFNSLKFLKNGKHNIFFTRIPSANPNTQSEILYGITLYWSVSERTWVIDLYDITQYIPEGSLVCTYEYN